MARLSPSSGKCEVDRLPDTQLPYPEVHWPKLANEPLREQFGVLKPIPPMPVSVDAAD
jgi:hypothetical protein